MAYDDQTDSSVVRACMQELSLRCDAMPSFPTKKGLDQGIDYMKILETHA
jgi:hypothetical protein